MVSEMTLLDVDGLASNTQYIDGLSTVTLFDVNCLPNQSPCCRQSLK